MNDVNKESNIVTIGAAVLVQSLPV